MADLGILDSAKRERQRGKGAKAKREQITEPKGQNKIGSHSK
jgi:hypothetical protein